MTENDNPTNQPGDGPAGSPHNLGGSEGVWWVPAPDAQAAEPTPAQPTPVQPTPVQSTPVQGLAAMPAKAPGRDPRLTAASLGAIAGIGVVFGLAVGAGAVYAATHEDGTATTTQNDPTTQASYEPSTRQGDHEGEYEARDEEDFDASAVPVDPGQTQGDYPDSSSGSPAGDRGGQFPGQPPSGGGSHSRSGAS